MKSETSAYASNMEVGFIGVDIAAVFTITLQITNYKWQPVLN